MHFSFISTFVSCPCWAFIAPPPRGILRNDGLIGYFAWNKSFPSLFLHLVSMGGVYPLIYSWMYQASFLTSFLVDIVGVYPR